MDKEYYLATTGISDVWDLNKVLLMLGPWCMTNPKNWEYFKGREFLTVDPLWNSAEKVKEANNYCYQIYCEAWPEITRVMNLIHSVNYPEKYWKVLIGPWLLHFIGVLYDRYMRVKNVRTAYPDIYTHVIEDGYDLSPENMQDFYGKIISDLYNFQLISYICKHLCINRIGVKLDDIKKLNNGAKRKNNRKNKVLKYIANMLKKILSTITVGPVVLSDMYHLKLKDYLALSIKTKFRLIKYMIYDNEGIASIYYSKEKRKAMAFQKDISEFENMLFDILPWSMPKVYIEGFKSNQYKALNKNEQIEVIGSATGWEANEEYKFYAANILANKKKISLEFQHGGGYGTSESLPVENIANEKDIFYVWGWGQNAGKKRNLPSPHLSRLKNKYCRRYNKVLFVSTTQPRYHYRFSNGSMPEAHIEYLDHQKMFLNAVPDYIRRDIVYRPHMIDFGWGEGNRITITFPEIKIIKKGKAVDLMKKVKLAIIDHPLTSFLEALAINVPTILFWDHDLYIMRPEAEKYFELLRKSGILYKYPLEAAIKMLEVYKNPQEWWETPEVQAARNIFLEHYGYSRKDWMDCWIKELSSLVSKTHV